MKSPAAAGRAIRFGVYELDLHTGELRKHGLKLRLQEKPFQILLRLLENPGEVVTREELRQTLWPADTSVDVDNSLNAAINKLREALGDSADQPRYVETLPRRGYRFVYGLNCVNDSVGVKEPATAEQRSDVKESTTVEKESTAANEANQRPRWFGWIAAVAAVAVLAATLFAVNVLRRREHVLKATEVPRIGSLAVLPLKNFSGDPAYEYFSDGLTDALITELAQLGSLRVISRTSSMQYKQTKKSLPEIARELNVDGIIEGTVQRSGERVRITAQLIYGPSDKHIWANSYGGNMRDVFALEQDVSQQIARQIQARLTLRNEKAARVRPVNLNALEAYLQGNYHLHKAKTSIPEGVWTESDKELRTAGNYFQQAINAEPDFASAYIGLAEAHNDLFWPSSEDFALMRGAAEKAVALDPASSEARTELALPKQMDWDSSGAEEEFRRAITLNPNNARAHDQLADCLDAMGRLEEGWKEHELAQELDPNQDHLSWALYRRGDYDRAIELLRKTLTSDPEDATMRWLLSQDYAQKGMYKEWVEELGNAMTLVGFPEIAGRLQGALATSGYAGAMRQWARELERLAASKQANFPGVLAWAYTSLGDKDRAFYWLGHGVDHPHMAASDPILLSFKVDPGLAPLRSDPRFKDLLRRAGLPP